MDGENLGNVIMKAPVKGERKHNRITFNPTNAKMGEKLYVTIPRLDNSLSIVPGTTHLIYNLKLSNDKSWPLNNLNRLFVQGLQVKLGRDIVYDNTGESVLRLYEDLWLSPKKRSEMARYGITSLEMRKSLSGTSGASTSSTTDGLLDKTMAEILQNQRLRLGQVLDDHGFHNPGKFETKYTITLPDKSTDVGAHLSGETVGDITLENLELEYDTIQNEELVSQQLNEMTGGKSYFLHHCTNESISNWDKDATLINENIHINRESMKTVIFLFKWADQNMDEQYVYPNINEVSININGKPNVIHSNPMKVDDFEAEARRYWSKPGSEMSTGQFFSSAFSIVVDFRSTPHKNKYNNGVKVHGNSGIQVTFKRKVTAKNVKCYTFVIADSIVQLDNTGYQKTIV